MVKFLACKGLDVNLDQLIEWICDEIIRGIDEASKDEEGRGGITRLIEFMETGEFIPKTGDLLPVKEAIIELKSAVRLESIQAIRPPTLT